MKTKESWRHSSKSIDCHAPLITRCVECRRTAAGRQPCDDKRVKVSDEGRQQQKNFAWWHFEGPIQMMTQTERLGRQLFKHGRDFCRFNAVTWPLPCTWFEPTIFPQYNQSSWQQAISQHCWTQRTTFVRWTLTLRPPPQPFRRKENTFVFSFMRLWNSE